MLAKGKGVHHDVPAHIRNEGSRRQKPAPTNRSYIRRFISGDAAKQAKAPYCTEQWNVNIEAVWAESIYTYPERPDDNPAEICASAEAETAVRKKNNRAMSSEVSRCHSKPETILNRSKGEVSQKEEGRNVRKAGEIRKFMVAGYDNRTPISELPMR